MLLSSVVVVIAGCRAGATCATCRRRRRSFGSSPRSPWSRPRSPSRTSRLRPRRPGSVPRAAGSSGPADAARRQPRRLRVPRRRLSGSARIARRPWFDASAFPAELEARGFTVHDDSRSNYLLTRLVLPTMFEGQVRHGDPGARAAVTARTRRRRAATPEVLEHARASPHPRGRIRRHVGLVGLEPPRHPERRPSDRGAWPIRARGRRPASERRRGDAPAGDRSDGFSRVMRDRIDAAYATAIALASEPHTRPRFVFVHVPAPHPPTVYRADGSTGERQSRRRVGHGRGPRRVDRTSVGSASSSRCRRSRTARCGRRRPPHGIGDAAGGRRLLGPRNATSRSTRSTPIASDTSERSSNFLATLTPGHPDLFRKPTTPINIISTPHERVHGTSVAAQPDRTFALSRVGPGHGPDRDDPSRLRASRTIGGCVGAGIAAR